MSLQRPPEMTHEGLLLANDRNSGGVVRFLVDGRVYELLPGEAHSFLLGDRWHVRFHRGETFGIEERTLEAGAYHFVVTDAGWALEKHLAP